MVFYSPMIEEYFASQMKVANYEKIDGGSRFYGEIRNLPGVWATGKTLEECRQLLFLSLEGWFVLSLQQNLPIPRFKLPRTKMKIRAHAKT